MKKLYTILIMALVLVLSILAQFQEGVHKGEEKAYHAGHRVEEKLHEHGHTVQEGVQSTGNRLDETFEKGKHRVEEIISRVSLGLEEARDAIKHKVGDSNIFSRGGDSIKHKYDAAGNIINEGLNKAGEGLQYGGHRTGEKFEEGKNTVDEGLERGKHRGQEFGYRAGHRIEETADSARGAVGDFVEWGKEHLHLGHRHGGVLGTVRHAYEGTKEGIYGAAESVKEGVYGAAGSVKEGVYDAARTVKEHIPGLDKVAGAFAHAKEEVIPEHRPTWREKLGDLYEDVKGKFTGDKKEETFKDKVQEKYDNIKGRFHDKDQKEDDGLKARLKEEVIQKAEQAIKTATGYKVAKEASEFVTEKILHKTPEEPEKEPSFINKAYDFIASKFRSEEKEVEEPEKLGMKDKVQEKLHEAQEAVSSKFHKGKENVEDLDEKTKNEDKGFTGKIKDSYDAVYSKLHRGKEENVEPEISEKDLNWREKIRESYEGAKDSVYSKLHRGKEENIEPETPEKDLSWKEKMKESYEGAKDAINYKLNRDKDDKLDENLKKEIPEEEQQRSGSRIRDTIDSIKEKLGWGKDENLDKENLDKENLDKENINKENLEKREETPVDESSPGLGSRIREGFHNVGEKIKSTVHRGGRDPVEMQKGEHDELSSELGDMFREQSPRLGPKGHHEEEEKHEKHGRLYNILHRHKEDDDDL